MGLMQLLTVGRSLSEARDQPHRYKLRTDRWPMLATLESPPSSRVERVDGPALGGSGAEQAEKTMKTETAAERNAEVQQAYPRGRWTLGGNPFKGQQTSPAPQAPKPAPAGQGELSLDRVKPLRNDLSDADLELIPRKPVENVFAAPGTEAPKRVSWWGRVKAVFGRGSRTPGK